MYDKCEFCGGDSYFWHTNVLDGKNCCNDCFKKRKDKFDITEIQYLRSLVSVELITTDTKDKIAQNKNMKDFLVDILKKLDVMEEESLK